MGTEPCVWRLPLDTSVLAGSCVDTLAPVLATLVPGGALSVHLAIVHAPT